MNPEDERRAKELFLEFEGSTFYMSRSGEDEEYRSLGVPPELEARWLAELTDVRLDSLRYPGNWKSINFLWHHSNFAHVRDVLAADPLGVLWEQCAFLEHRLKYIGEAERRGFATSSQVDEARRQTREATGILARRARSEGSRSRIDAIRRGASSLGNGER
jgi:hypothetical protein